MHEVRYALRSLKNNRGFTVVAVLALALGIGANTAVFSVVNAVFLRPLPYADATNLVEVTETRRGGGTISVSYPNSQDWQRQATVFEGMAATAVFDSTFVAGGSADRIPVAYVGAGFAGVFRVKPVLGRDFASADDNPGAAPVAILTHAFWQARFGSNPSIIGSTVIIDQRSYNVIGVFPREFRFYRDSADVFAPISNIFTQKMMYLRGNHNNMYVVARLKPGVRLDQAQGQMTTIAKRLEQAYPDVNTRIGARITTLRELLSGDSRTPVGMLAGAVCLVLLIACVNVSNLLLARAAGRKKEMALRAALGATRWQVVRQLLAESVILAVAGGVLGTLLARWSFAGLVRLVPASLTAGGISIDFRVLGFTLLVSVLTGVLFGLVPAMDVSRLNLADSMRQSGATGASSRSRLRDGLVVSEVALALVLLVGAGLLLRTLQKLMEVKLGFATENILTMRVSLPDTEEVLPAQASAFFDRLIERVQGMPGVEAAGGISHPPLGHMWSSAVCYRDDRPAPPRGELPSANQRVASPEYFTTLRIPLLRGRMFTPADGRITDFRRPEAMEWFTSNTFSVVINQTMAQRFYPGEDPLGKAIRFGFPEMHGPRLVIVGVVADTRDYGADTEPAPVWYFSGYHFLRQGVTLVIRTRTEPMTLARSVRRAVAELHSAALVTEVSTMETRISNSMASRRLNMLLLALFAGLALLLAAVGVYGVMAFSVNRRRQEIGVRVALGAGSSEIMKLVLGRAALLGGLGVVAGSLAAFGLTRLIASMLYAVDPADPATFGAVAAALFTVALAAGWVPARRATRVSPVTVLRCE